MKKNNFISSKKENFTLVDQVSNGNNNQTVTFNQLLINIDSTLNNVLSDGMNKLQRQKLMSIQDTIKKYLSSNSFSSCSSQSNINQKKSHQETDFQKEKEEEQVCTNVFIKRRSKVDSQMCKGDLNVKENTPTENQTVNGKEECSRLKEENVKLKEEIEKLKQKYSGMIETEDKKANKKIETLKYTINEERDLNRELILQTQSLEDALKKLNTEYNSLSYRFAKLNNESAMFERTISTLKQNLSMNKHKFEEIVKVNEDLKSRHFSKEEFISQHNSDLKREIRKNTLLKERVVGLEKTIEKLESESKVKEIRLVSLRQMNQKLEGKCGRVMEKLKNITDLQRQNDDVYQTYHKKLEYMDDQNKKIEVLKSEKEKYLSNQTISRRDYEDLKEENISLKKQVLELKSINEDSQLKIDSYEGRFKNCLLSRVVSVEKEKEGEEDGRYGKSVRSNNKTFYSSQISTLNRKEYMKNEVIHEEDVSDEKVVSNSNMNSNLQVNHLAIDEMKPCKLVVKDMKFEVLSTHYD